MQEQRKFYLDYIRILATLAVITLHVSSKYIGGEKRTILIMWNGLTRWAVPTFVMISGALFLNSPKKITMRVLCKKHILRMVSSLLFWTVVCVCVDFKLKRIDIHTCKMYLITGYWHMWFVWMIVGIYIAIPFVKKIAEDDHLVTAYLIIFFIAGILIHTLRYCITPYTVFSEREGINRIFQNVDNMNLGFFCGWVGYFLLGYYLDKKVLSRRLICLSCVIGIASFAVGIVIHEQLTLLKGAVTVPFDDSFSITSFFESIFVFNFSKYCLKSPKLNIIRKMIISLSKCSFGVYMVHISLRELFEEYWSLNAITLNPIIMVPMLSMLIFITGYLISLLIHQIPLLRSYIV